MNILVLGGGGREHAIAWAIAKSPKCDKLYVAPGNGGTANVAENIPTLDMMNGDAVLASSRIARSTWSSSVPRPRWSPVWRTRCAPPACRCSAPMPSAQLEGSKDYSKHFMDANDIPTARYASFTDLEPALATCASWARPSW